MSGKLLLLCSALIVITNATPSLKSCEDSVVWSEVLREYIFLSEDAISERVSEWLTLCETHNNKSESLKPEMLRSLWQDYTSFVPLDDCSCLKTGSSSLEVTDEIPAALFVDYPILGVILLVLVYLLRIYYARTRQPLEMYEQHLYHASNDFNRRTELQR